MSKRISSGAETGSGLQGLAARVQLVPFPSRALCGRRRTTFGLFCFTQEEFSGRGAAFVVGLNQHRGIGEGGFLDFHFDFGAAGGVGDCLRVKRSDIGTGKAEREARTSSR